MESKRLEVKSCKFLIYEHVPGNDLHKWLYTSRLKLSASERLDILRGISQGMAYINDQAVIHNDIKPANILIDDRRRPKVRV